MQLCFKPLNSTPHTYPSSQNDPIITVQLRDCTSIHQTSFFDRNGKFQVHIHLQRFISFLFFTASSRHYICALGTAAPQIQSILFTKEPLNQNVLIPHVLIF